MVILGSDHAGISLKAELYEILSQMGYEILDMGTFTSDQCDYPEVAKNVSRKVLEDPANKGILVCGTGIGMSIAANRLPGVRCALCSDTFSAKAAREHNDANIIALGARVIGAGLALDLCKVFLETEFSGAERHKRRVDMIEF